MFKITVKTLRFYDEVGLLKPSHIDKFTGYENISAVYAFLLQWIESNGYQVAGNGREQYIDGCWNKESPDDYLTEIQMPIKLK